MNIDYVPPDKIPRFCNREEFDSMVKESSKQKNPVIAVGSHNEESYILRYDFDHLNQSLTDEAHNKIKQLLEQKREQHINETSNDIDSMYLDCFRNEGKIFPIKNEEAAAEIGSEISKIISHSSNWETTSLTKRFVDEHGREILALIVLIIFIGLYIITCDSGPVAAIIELIFSFIWGPTKGASPATMC